MPRQEVMNGGSLCGWRCMRARTALSSTSKWIRKCAPRHCERSEAIQLAARWKNGLLPPSLFELRPTSRRFAPLRKRLRLSQAMTTEKLQ